MFGRQVGRRSDLRQKRQKRKRKIDERQCFRHILVTPQVWEGPRWVARVGAVVRAVTKTAGGVEGADDEGLPVPKRGGARRAWMVEKTVHAQPGRGGMMTEMGENMAHGMRIRLEFGSERIARLPSAKGGPRR